MPEATTADGRRRIPLSDAVAHRGRRIAVVGIGVVVLVGFLVVYAGARFDSATTGLVLVALALLACLRALHAMVGVLGRDDVTAVVDGEGEFGGSTRRELREERRRLLRAINELRFDHEMGKLSPADYESVREGYELRLVEVMRALDAGASLHPELAKRLGLVQTDAQAEVSVTKGDDAAASESSSADAPASATTPAPSPASETAASETAASETAVSAAPAPEAPASATAASSASASEMRATVNDGFRGRPEARICAACDGSNDGDARFCKHCGKELAA